MQAKETIMESASTEKREFDIKEVNKKIDKISIEYGSVFSKPDKNLNNDEKKKIPFRDQVNNLLYKNIGNFVWGAVHYSVDIKTRKIFYASRIASLNPNLKYDFPQGAKGNFLTKENATYYALNEEDIDGNECNAGKKIADYLSTKKIARVAAPSEISSGPMDLKHELLNCIGFVVYILVEAFRVDYPDVPYHWVAERIEPVVRSYFEHPDKIKNMGSYEKNIQKGDLLLFSKIGMGMQGLVCEHIGFFYGYDEAGPLICDLWNRDSTNHTKIVAFKNCADYEKHSFIVTRLCLDILYKKLIEVISQVTKNLSITIF